MKVKTITPLTATRASVEESIPPGVEIDIDLHPISGTGTTRFVYDGQEWETTLDQIKSAVDFSVARSVGIRKEDSK
jgi:hypothetical protein